MQRNINKFIKGFVLTAVVALILLVLISVFYFIPKFKDFKKILSAPPTVIVHAPIQGEKIPEGSLISSRATATGTNPLDRVELWIDGKIVDKQQPSNDLSLGLTTLHATIQIKISEGMHMLYWRVIDTKGQIGQSPPITIIGTERLGGGETTTIQAEEGQTLQQIAEELGGEPDVLTKLNPGLGPGGLISGTGVTVPAPPPSGQQKPPQGGSIITDPPIGGPINVTNLLLPADPIINLGPLISLVSSNFPAPPTDLEVGFENCTVQLAWNDNSDNEQAYQIWMKAGAGLPSLIADLPSRRGTGKVSYVFESPSFGIYGFWVEAVNGMGAQPSQVKWLFIDDSTCRGQQATGLEVEILDLNTGGFSGQLYCYISFEGSPETKIPEHGFFNDFVNVATEGENFDLEGTGNVYLIPVPADEEVSIEGKCLGHLGTDVIELGTLNKSIPKVQWNGMRLTAKAGNVVLGYRIQPHDLEDPSGLYRYTDNDLIIPKITSVTARTDRDPLTRSRLARNVILSWSWDVKNRGGEITNFVIAMDESMEFRVAGKNSRTEAIVLPTSCGRTYRFAVAAMSKGGARSEYSDWYIYSQPSCDYYAEVIFDTFSMTDFDDNENLPRHLDCDEAEMGFEISVSSVNTVWRNWDGGLRWHYYGTAASCNKSYHFTQFPFNKGAPGKRDSFTVMVDPDTSTVNIYVQFTDIDSFIVPWDTDAICVYRQPLTMDLDDWVGYSDFFTEICDEPGYDGQDGTITIKYLVKGYKTPQ